MDRWKGKVAVVTGASAGIGEEICEHLVTSGLKVVGLARRKERLDEISKKLEGKQGQFFSVKTDISIEEDVINAFEWITKNVGIVHILVNNAGLGHSNNLLDGDAKQWKEVLDINLLGLCVATREAIKIMRDNEVDGQIIHMNSLAGHTVLPLPNMNVYTAAKHEVTTLTETLRQELISIGSKIKITSISPGLVKTEIFQIAGFPNEVIKDIENSPILLPEDVAQAVIFVLGTPKHVQVHEMFIRAVGSPV